MVPIPKLLFFGIFISISLVTSYKIEGQLLAPSGAQNDWVSSAKVIVDGNKYIGFVQQNGYFVISNVPSGSYLLEFVHPVYSFQSVRVEISSKAKIRARKVLPVKPNTVITVQYPLRITSYGRTPYFQEREQLRTLDLILNPTVLVLVAPLLLFMILPKLADTNDPEFQKEIQNINIFNPKQGLPDFSEMLTSIQFGNQKSVAAITNRKTTKKKPAIQ